MGNSTIIDMDVLKENLRKKGYKLTPQRRAIVDTIIDNEGKHLTIEQIYDKVKKVCPEIGLATVYRTILLLLQLNVVSRLELNDGCTRYELVHKNEVHRHHHLICNVCGKVFEVQDDLLEQLENDIQQKYNFKIVDHAVQFYGICSNCQKKMKDE